MDEATRRRLYNYDHALCLAWFEEHSDTFTRWPEPLGDNLILVTQHKGIYKPRWMPYALSVRSTPKGPYKDDPPVCNDDGSWLFRYATEANKGLSGDSLYTYKALRACMDGQIPVGVLYKEAEDSPYLVLGLGLPTMLEETHVLFESYSPGAASLQALSIGPEVTVEGLLDAMANLRTQSDADGRAKRHQPLALLWAIGKARRRAARLTGWPVARSQIGALIQGVGAASKSNAYLPFLALAGTGIWELTATPPQGGESSDRRRWLNNQNPPVRGGLTKPVYDLFAGSADAVAEAVMFLLGTYFDGMTPAQASQVLDAAGIGGIPGHLDDSERAGAERLLEALASIVQRS